MKEQICRKIYREAFCDPDTSFEDLLFGDCFKHCKTISENGKPVSMLFALPCILKSREKERNAIYIYAAATNKAYRGQGYMARLLEEIKKENKLIFLRPANKTLIDFYSRFGFYTVKAIHSDNCLFPTDEFKTLTDKIGADKNGEEYTLMYYSEKTENFNCISFQFSMN